MKIYGEKMGERLKNNGSRQCEHNRKNNKKTLYRWLSFHKRDPFSNF